MSENEKNETQPPLTIAMVVDTSGNRGNGTSNSALQWAQELERQGHHVRLVGIGAPEYPARVNHVPLVSWVAKKQQMQFAEPSDTLFRKAFDGVDVVHIYTPFRFGQHACKVAKQMGIAVTAGYHVQPENVTYSAGPLKYVPGIDSFIYWLFDIWLYRKIDHVHVPTELGASLLRSHGYKSKLHVISPWTMWTRWLVVSTGGSTIRRSSPSGAAPTPNIRKPIIRWNRPYVSSSRWNVRRSPITVAEWRLPQSQYNRYT